MKTNDALKVLATFDESVIVHGPRAEVKRYAFSRGIDLGAPSYRLMAHSNGVSLHDSSTVTGHEFKDQDGGYAGLIVYERDGLATAVVRAAR